MLPLTRKIINCASHVQVLFRHCEIFVWQLDLTPVKTNRNQRDQRAHVAEHGLLDRFGQLVNVLLRQRQAEPVFARLRKNRRKRIGREVLELVNEQVKFWRSASERVELVVAPVETMNKLRC